MYYEEKLIDGVLHWRGAPDGEWLPVPASKLSQRVLDAEQSIQAIYELRLLTAEPSVIARAACKAMGIEVE